MKPILLRALLGVATVLLAIVGWLVFQLNNPPSMAPYAGLALPPVAESAPGLKASFFGVATLLLDDGETAIMTDGFFSRPEKLSVAVSKIAPDRDRIANALKRAGVNKLAAVIAVHSHYDHAMDTPEVARLTGAQVVGSESTANVARGWGLQEDRIRVVRDGETLKIGRFEITFVPSEHAPSPVTGGVIAAPLVPPVRAEAYAEGGSYSLLIRHDGKTMLIQGSAGFIPGALKGRQADVAFLGIGLLGNQKEEFRDAYWREVVATVGVRRVIPIHWDDFGFPVDQPLQAMPAPFDNVERSMNFVLERGRQDHVDIRFAPVWQRIDPFAGL